MELEHIFLIIFLLFAIVVMIVFHYLKKWKCEDGKCIKTMNGNYKKKEECEKNCQTYDHEDLRKKRRNNIVKNAEFVMLQN